MAHHIYVANRGTNRNPNFRNSEIVRIPMRYSDGQQLLLSDKFGQTHLRTFQKKTQFFDILFYNVLCYLLTKQNMKEVLYDDGEILDMNHIISIGNVRTTFGRTSDIGHNIGHRTGSDRFSSETDTAYGNYIVFRALLDLLNK